jgi:hypothetical protein
MPPDEEVDVDVDVTWLELAVVPPLPPGEL